MAGAIESGGGVKDASSPFRTLCGSALALLFLGSVAQGANDAVPVGYREVALPLIEKHCLGCHGEKTARAGFRIDLLKADFASAEDGRAMEGGDRPDQCRGDAARGKAATRQQTDSGIRGLGQWATARSGTGGQGRRRPDSDAPAQSR